MSIELPQAIESEKAVLGSVLISPDCFIDLQELLESSDFFLSMHQELWEAFIALSGRGDRIDLVNVHTELQKRNSLFAKKLFDLMDELISVTMTSSSAMQYATEIKNKSMLRKLIRLTENYGHVASLPDAEADQLVNEIEKGLLDIADLAKSQKSIEVGGIIEDLQKDIVKNEKRGWVGYNTGFAKMDADTGGLIPTHIWIIGAYTGTAKTYFLLQMLLNVVKNGAKCVFFSTEMNRKWTMLRLLANISGVGVLKILKGNLAKEEAEDVERAKAFLEKYKDQMFLYDTVRTVSEIRLKAKKIKAKYGLNVIFVDYIQNLKGKGKLFDTMAEASNDLSELALELEVTIIVASQVSQSAAGWQSKEAIEFKGAGDIAEVSDVSIWIRKTEKDKFEREVILRKVRHGITGKFYVRLEFPSGKVLDEQAKQEVLIEAEKDGGDVKDQLL